MTANDIRKKFLDFFAKQGHAIISSDTLVPKDDPTVLFTTAGMQQFKRQFLGHIGSFTRAASSQKCLRTDDLGKVGKTPFHHTFFEMLGNFSFGDYFKKEAIAWAWEFLTKELSIPEAKLCVSVYEDDREAEDIWLKDIKIPKEKLIRLGDQSNFWPAEAKTKGPNGPCGPCSEIFFDYGVQTGCGKKDCSPACDCGRFSEVWNLVFTQFNRKDDGILEPLPNKNIDTGMGLERLVAVIQGKKNNFETDLFAPILLAIDKKIIGNLEKSQKLLIADHIRAIVFGICDGVIPSNENRGYVMKRLIIDATDLAASSGHQDAVIFKLVDTLTDTMKEPYPELMDKKKEISEIIKKTEEAYIRVRKERIPELQKRIQDILHQAMSEEDELSELGSLIFRFRDTYGLTLPTIRDIAFTVGVNQGKWKEVLKVFDTLMEEQKNRSRAASKMTGDVFTDLDLDLNVLKTVFFGYTQHKATGRILKIFRDNQDVREAKKGDRVKMILDQTPFYAESGGQIGDTGAITKDASTMKVEDTQRISDRFIHIGVVTDGLFRVHDTVQTQIDSERRLSIMRNHTATHLLQSALRKILGTHVKQQGSLVSDNRLRLDFTHPKAVTKEELDKIEQRVNENILSCQDVHKESMSLEQAKEKGALAFFAEKYSDTVNVVSIGDVSKELCGGTHLPSVGQIGSFKITGESAIAQGIRRIEAITGHQALAFVKKNEERLAQLGQILKAPPEELADRAQNQLKRIKHLEKELGQLQFDSIKLSLDEILMQAPIVKNTKIVSHVFRDLDIDLLRKIADVIKQKAHSSVITLGSRADDHAMILIAVTDDLIKKNIKANELIKDVAPIIAGSGGGRPQWAQAGSKDPSKILQAVKKVEHLVKERI
ncbi:MAG: alanine--tRNA ligase [Candidatus Omnitrophota bacterium]